MAMARSPIPARPRRPGASRTTASTPTATARCSRWPTRSYNGGDTWSLSNAWSAAAQLTWKVSPQFEIDPEIAYASVDYGSAAATYWNPILSQKATAGGSARCSTGRRSRTSTSRSTRSTSRRISRRRFIGPTIRSPRPIPQQLGRFQRPHPRRPLVLTDLHSGRRFGPGAKAPGFFVLADLAELQLCSGECARHSPIRQRQRQTRRAVGGRQEEGLDGSASSRAAPISFAIGDERVATAIASPICGGRGVLRATLARSPAGTATGRGSKSPRDRPRQVCDRRVAAGPRR